MRTARFVPAVAGVLVAGLVGAAGAFAQTPPPAQPAPVATTAGGSAVRAASLPDSLRFNPPPAPGSSGGIRMYAPGTSAVCNDGAPMSGSSIAGACLGDGGVRAWLAQPPATSLDSATRLVSQTGGRPPTVTGPLSVQGPATLSSAALIETLTIGGTGLTPPGTPSGHSSTPTGSAPPFFGQSAPGKSASAPTTAAPAPPSPVLQGLTTLIEPLVPSQQAVSRQSAATADVAGPLGGLGTMAVVAATLALILIGLMAAVAVRLARHGSGTRGG